MNFSCLILMGGGILINNLSQFFIAQPTIKKPTLLKLKGLFQYKDQSWKDVFPNFFLTRDLKYFKIKNSYMG